MEQNEERSTVVGPRHGVGGRDEHELVFLGSRGTS